MPQSILRVLEALLHRCQLIQRIFDLRLVILDGRASAPNQKSKLPNQKCNKPSGDHTQVATPVPIPNTAVKHLGPMIVRTARK